MTPILYSHILLPSSTPTGTPILAVIAKARFRLAAEGGCVPDAEPAPLLSADKFFEPGDPLVNACEAESDLIPWKLMTDVIVLGKARAPRNKEVVRMGVGVVVGRFRKDIVVSGDRKVVWKPLAGPAFTEALPFVEMDLRYERAYGGVDIHSGNGETPLIYPRNPIGRGFVVKKKKETLDGLALPNLEDPRMMLTPEGLCAIEPQEWHRLPMPAGFGVFGKAWFPRCTFAGVMPVDVPIYEEMHETASGQIPRDHVEKFKSLKQPMMDFRFFSGAAPGLALPYLSGTEPVRIEGMTADKPLEFALPGGRPAISIDYGDGVRNTDVVLQTVVIRVEERTIDLTWRGATEYPGLQKLEKIQRLDVNVVTA